VGGRPPVEGEEGEEGEEEGEEEEGEVGSQRKTEPPPRGEEKQTPGIREILPRP